MPNPQSPSQTGFRVAAAVLAAVAMLPAGQARAAVPVTVTDRFFRSDLGRAAAGTGPLPDRLDDPASLRWRTPLDPGHSTPVVTGGRIFLTAHAAAARQLTTVALDAATGRVLWQRAVTPPRIEQLHSIGSPATASPATDGRHVFVFFGSHGLLAYDLDGKPAWEQRMGPFQDEYGAGSSPVVADGKVIVLQDHDTESFLAAFDANTGRPAWKIARPDAVRSYSTPALRDHDGRRELLVAGSLELCGHDPATGRRLWSVPGLARIVIPSPIPAGDQVFMASWAPGGDASRRLALDPWATALGKWDRNKDQLLARAEVDDPEVLDRYFRMDLDGNDQLNEAEWNRHAEVFRRARNALLALRPPAGGATATAAAEPAAAGDASVTWSHGRGVPYVSTPLLDQGALWMVKDGGIVTRLDAGTGTVHYEERLPGSGNYYASPVTGDGKVYFASQLGVVSVIDAGPAWRVIASHDFHAKIFATPVLDGNNLLIRTEQALHAFSRPPAKP